MKMVNKLKNLKFKIH